MSIEAIEKAFAEASEAADVIITSGGVSVGDVPHGGIQHSSIGD